MLVEFSVGNYQAFGTPQRVPVKPITLIFGPNGAGKSALLKSLLVSRHAVLEGKLQKSQGAYDRHPGIFKAMQRCDECISFGWLLRLDETVERLDVKWGEYNVNKYHTPEIALHLDGKLLVRYDDIYSPCRPGPSLDGEINVVVKQAMQTLGVKGKQYNAVFDKLKESFLSRLSVEGIDNLFPGSNVYDFDYDDTAPTAADRDLLNALQTILGKKKKFTGLIKRIKEGADQFQWNIWVPLSKFIISLTKELQSLVYHGPIRPVCDEIKSTEETNAQMGDWLKLADNRDLCEKVNKWLASAGGNHQMKVIVSRTVTMHDLTTAGFENITWDDILQSAYFEYIGKRMMLSSKILNCSSAALSTITPKHNEIIREWVADKLAHDGTISAAIASNFEECADDAEYGISVPAHYKKDADGNYVADVSAFPPHLRHPKPNPAEAWDDYCEANEEQRLAAARAYHALLAGRGEMKRMEDFLLKGMNNILSNKVSQLENPHQNTDLHKVLFIDSGTNKAVQASNLGLGFSQMLPLVISAFASEDQLIAIEQPELHVHPALQTELADLFIQSAIERKNRFLIETHSEHLILRVLRRIRETSDQTLPPDKQPIRPEDVAVLYVQPSENGSEVIELPVTPDGDFAVPWPNGFFAERSAELF